MNDIYEILYVISQSTEEKVLATIIHVEGSAYRKEGTMMLFTVEQEYGLLSGGCLESDLKERAKQLMINKGTDYIVYDTMTMDELSWGQQSGCNGIVTVLLEFVDEELQAHFQEVNERLKKGDSVISCKTLSTNYNVHNYIVMSENKLNSSDHIRVDPSILIQQKTKAILLENHSNRYFVQLFQPKRRLIIFGSGPDVRPLVDFAAKVGFSIITTDWRPAYCKEEYFPSADQVICETPCSFINDFSFLETDSIVIMTHNFEKDKQVLTEISKKKLQYVGILGPRQRTERIYLNKDIPDWLHSPIGISIGSVGPEEIAISIIAEIIYSNRLQETK